MSAVGRGGLRFPLPYGDWNTDHHDIIYQYPGGLEGWLISIKHTAGYRDVKEQFYGAKGMLETSRSYMKVHGMTPDVRYKSADDLRDTSLMEKEESISDITGEATVEKRRRVPRIGRDAPRVGSRQAFQAAVIEPVVGRPVGGLRGNHLADVVEDSRLVGRDPVRQ